MDRNLNNNEIIDCVQYEQPFDPRALYSPVAYFYTAGNGIDSFRSTTNSY